MFRFFQSFLNEMKASFQRIARATKNELTTEDLQQEAWIVADEISKKRGREIDFSDPEDQDLVIRAVNHRNVKRGDWQMRKSVRIDQDAEDDESAIKWSERLPAQASSDPLVSLLLRESASNAEEMLVSSYSQAAAYVMVFVRFKNSRQAVCTYLVISDSALGRRITFATDTVRVQPSLFDRIERISEDFMPLPGKQYSAKPVQVGAGAQWSWEFE